MGCRRPGPWSAARPRPRPSGSLAALVEQNRTAVPGSGPAIDRGLFGAVDAALAASFDARNGSWGGAPKFPQPMTLEYLLRRIAAGDTEAVGMVAMTLDKMADGGIRDQLGGGFHRYATDQRWLVPHFEQMLYDNAQLARAYLHAWAALGIERYREVATGVLDYMIRELTTDDGAFASSQDADTEGIEGLTFTWRAAEIREVLGPVPAARFADAYGVTDEGNWEDVTILSRIWPAFDEPPFRDDAALEAELAAARARLLERRATRAQPARDDKALAAWNGLAIAAFAEAGRLLGEPRYTAAAVRAATTIVDGLLAAGRVAQAVVEGRPGGRCAACSRTTPTWPRACWRCTRPRSTSAGSRWRAALPTGSWIGSPTRRAASSTPRPTTRRLITRPKDPQDNAVPSGGAMATTVLLRLAAWTGEGRYREAAERALGTVAPFLARYPTGFAQWLVAASFAASDVVEVAIVGDPADAGDARAARAGLVDVAAAAGARRRAAGPRGRRRPCRCCTTAWPSTAGRRPTCAATSPATCRSPTPRRSPSSSGGSPLRPADDDRRCPPCCRRRDRGSRRRRRPGRSG